MKLTIKPVENPWYNCLDVLLLTVTQHWGLEHRLMFANGWRFHYEKAPDTAQTVSFEKALDVRELVENRNIEDALGRYHGLLIQHNAMADIEQAVSLVRSELAKGIPVALGVDAYCCHWSSAYRKYHLEHYCLAIGLDEEKQNFIVIDPYLTMEIVEFPFSQYAETLGDSLIFGRSPAIPDAPNWRDLIEGRASAMLSRFQEIRALADDLEKYLDFHQEVTRHEDPFASRLVLYFKTLGFSRLNYAECLAYLAEMSAECSIKQAAVRMKEHGTEFFKIFLLLMKTSLTPHRFKVSNIAQKLRELADREEVLAKELLRAAQSNSGAIPLNAVMEAR
jgi:hypothetical protein